MAARDEWSKNLLRKVAPRFAGVCAVVVGILIAITAGFMIANPLLSVAGAIVLVAATVLLSVGSIWLLRHNWDEPWPPDVVADQAKVLRRRRVLLVFNCVLLSALITYGISSAVQGMWWTLGFAVILAGNTSINIFIYYKLQKSQSATRTSDGRDSPNTG